MNVVMYSTHCPKCCVLEKKLKDKKIEYEEVNDIEIMQEKGITTVPILEVDGEMMDFKTAFNYIEKLQ